MGKVDKFYVGAGINILLGITDIHLESDDMYVSTSSDSIFIKGENSLITNIDNDQNINFGNGFSIDLGVAANINPKINVSLAMQNLFGSITWPKTYTNFHEFSISIASDELEDISDYNSSERQTKDSKKEIPLDTILDIIDNFSVESYSADSYSGGLGFSVSRGLLLGDRLRGQSYYDSYFKKVPVQPVKTIANII